MNFRLRSHFFIFILLVILIECQAAPIERDSVQYAKDLHKRALVADLHNDLISKICKDGIDIGVRNPKTHLDLPKIKEGGLDLLFCAAWSSPSIEHYNQAKCIFDMIDLFLRMVEKYRDQIEIVSSASDINRIVSAGKTAALITIEGGHAIENDLALLRTFYRIGVRSMTLTWNNSNEWADSSPPDRSKIGTSYFRNIPMHNGLTEFGKSVIREMNRLGMIVDVSHTSPKTVRDVLEVTTKPIIASHSCAYTLTPHYRNLNDDLLKAIARNGGVIGVNFYSPFLDADFDNRMKRELTLIVKPGKKATVAQKEEAAHRVAPSIERVIEHINYLVKVAGVDHVALGSDFDGIEYAPKGLEDVTKLPDITMALIKNGYSDEDIMKILGGNALRVIEAVMGK